MTSPETARPFGWWGQFVERLGTAALLLSVAFPVLWAGFYSMLGAGVDHTLHTYNTPLLGIDFVVFPLAAIAAAWLHWGAAWITAPRVPRAIRARSRWGEEGTPPPGASPVRHLLPLLGASVVVGMFVYLMWSWNTPRDLLGGNPQIGVQRWIGMALVAGVGYFGMILFPRLTAWMAGAIAGPTLFAIVGYTLFPSFMRDPEGRVFERLTDVFAWGALALAIAAIVAMALSQRLRQQPLSYALWMGAFMLCLAVSGTFNGAYPGR